MLVVVAALHLRYTYGGGGGGALSLSQPTVSLSTKVSPRDIVESLGAARVISVAGGGETSWKHRNHGRITFGIHVAWAALRGGKHLSF